MPRIDFETTIRAPIHRVFDLCRSVDAHITSATATSELVDLPNQIGR